MGMKLNEIKSPLRLSSKANRSIKNILKKLENTRPRILLCPFIPHLEIVRAQSWKCPLTYFSPQERFLCTNTNPPPSFKTTIKKKKKERLHFQLGQPLIHAKDKESQNTPAHTSPSPRPPASRGISGSRTWMKSPWLLLPKHHAVCCLSGDRNREWGCRAEEKSGSLGQQWKAPRPTPLLKSDLKSSLLKSGRCCGKCHN